jgi:hypothetical protein
LSRFAAYALLFVSATLFLDLFAYLLLGHSLGHCPAEGDCNGWVTARMTLAVFSAIPGGAILSNAK